MKVLDVDEVMSFMNFVTNRHASWEARQAGMPQPWCADPIVQTRKFTNVFRVLDYGSQFLVKELLDPDLSPPDTLLRCFLYRHTGRWTAWEYSHLMNGDYPTIATLDEAEAAFLDYREATGLAFTNAYLVFPQSHTKGTDKLVSIFDLARRLFNEESPECIVPKFFESRDQRDRFSTFKDVKGVGDFMAMQVLTDWGYSEHCGEDLENEFIVCGPGARKGAAVLDPAARPEKIVSLMRDMFMAQEEPRLGTRAPSLMDVQNCLCEYSKYVRYRNAPSPQAGYLPAHPGVQLPPVLPSHW